MNQLSYNVSNEKIKKLGFKPSNQIRKEIFKTLKLFNFENKKIKYFIYRYNHPYHIFHHIKQQLSL